jgi:hypothetical protein
LRATPPSAEVAVASKKPATGGLARSAAPHTQPSRPSKTKTLAKEKMHPLIELVLHLRRGKINHLMRQQGK